MKKHIRYSLICYFRNELLKSRYSLKITQEEMADRLAMSVRNYASLECGKSCCGLITMLFFLKLCYDDRYKFVDELISLLDEMDSE